MGLGPQEATQMPQLQVTKPAQAGGLGLGCEGGQAGSESSDWGLVQGIGQYEDLPDPGPLDEGGGGAVCLL